MLSNVGVYVCKMQKRRERSSKNTNRAGKFLYKVHFFFLVKWSSLLSKKVD